MKKNLIIFVFIIYFFMWFFKIDFKDFINYVFLMYDLIFEEEWVDLKKIC